MVEIQTLHGTEIIDFLTRSIETEKIHPLIRHKLERRSKEVGNHLHPSEDEWVFFLKGSVELVISPEGYNHNSVVYRDQEKQEK